MKTLLIFILSLIPILAWSQGNVTVPKKLPPVKKENQQRSKSKSKSPTKTQPKIEYEILDYSKRTAVLKSANYVSGAFVIPSSVTINNMKYSVTTLGPHAFSGRIGLTSVTIPNSVTMIGTWAFSGCSGLTSVEIPNSVTKVGDWAFFGCSGLTSVTIPSKFKSEEDKIFKYCTNLKTINYTN